MEGLVGAAPTTFWLKARCSAVELQTLNYEKRALSPLYDSTLKNIRVYCLALPAPIVNVREEATTVVVILRLAVVSCAILLLYQMSKKCQA